MSKKSKLPPEIERVKENLEKPNFLVDYFLLCGIEPSVCLDEPDFFSEDKLKDRVFTPKILSKCPPFEKKIIGVDEGILDFCFPNGFKIKFSKKPLPNETFSIILDNNLSSYEYPQKYVTCFLFYECLVKYKNLEDLIKKSKNNLKASITSDSSKFDDNSSIFSTSSFASLKNSSNMKNKNSQFYHCNYYYIPKCIVLVSIWPYITLHQKILKSIYQVSRDTGDKPLEKIIQNLILEVPIPPRGIFHIDYQLINEKLNLQQSGMNQLPILNFSLHFIDEKLNFNEIMEIMKHILYDSKIMFFSKNVNLLTNIILGFLSLISPMKYPFQVTSCLPKENYSIIESISPYLFGIKEAYSEDFFSNNGLSIESMTILCIDLDSTAEGEEKLHLFFPPGEEYPPLPKKLTEKLKLDYTAFIESYNTSQSETKSFYSEKNNPKATFSQEEYNSKFQTLFFEFNVNILRGYDKYLNDNYFSIENIGNTNVTTLFKIDEFVSSQSSYDRPFYKKFVGETQRFSDFIFKRMIPKNLKDKVEIMFINEKIIEVSNKNNFFSKRENLNFLNSKDYEIKNSYAVPRHQSLSENEYNWLIENYTSQLINAQQIKILDNPADKDKKRIVFQYLLFPILNFDLFFNSSNVSDYDSCPTFFEDIDNASRELILKGKENQDNFVEMENYVYLSWLQLWAFAFEFIDKAERQYQFNLMIGVLDKIIFHEMDIFDMLFTALKNENEEDMIQRLYKKMISFKLNPDSYIHSIISALIDKKSMQDIICGGKGSRKFTYDNVDRKYRKRTFRIACEKSVLGETVTFTKFYPCVECGKDVDLKVVSTNFQKINRDVNWAYCKHCEGYILPKLIIQVGKELNTEGFDSPECTRTSTIDEVVLHSPHDLKINIKDGIFRENNGSLNTNKFKLKFGPIFWNSIWYFHLNNLQFDFMLPYEEEIFKFGDESLCENVLVEGNGYPKVVLIDNISKEKQEELKKKTIKEEGKEDEKDKEGSKNPEEKKDGDNPSPADEKKEESSNVQIEKPGISEEEIVTAKPKKEKKLIQKEKKFDLSKFQICHEIERFFISDELYFRFVTKSRPNQFNNSTIISERFKNLQKMKEEKVEISEIDYYDLENFRSRYKLTQMQTEKNDNTFIVQTNMDKNDELLTRVETESSLERCLSCAYLERKIRLDDEDVEIMNLLNNSLIYEDPLDITSRLLGN